MKNIFFNIAAIDPGRSKWGVAILDHRGEILFRAIYSIELFSHTFGLLCDKYSCKLAVLGDQTNHLYFQRLIADLNIPCELVDERFSSEEARKLFFQLESPQGWRKLLPKWLLYPHRDYDDVSAVILGRRYLFTTP